MSGKLIPWCKINKSYIIKSFNLHLLWNLVYLDGINGK